MSQTRTTFRDGDHLDLACERLGGRVLAANDEFFAAKENLIRDADPVWDEDRYVETGKWMDGWETRRRRDLGPEAHDWCLLQLGCPGRIHALVVDTAHFTGNFPESCAVDALAAPAEATAEELLAAEGWAEILPRSPLQGDSKNRFSVDSPYRWTHLRLRIYPDGGVARLRVLGEIIPSAEELPPALDLASLKAGARVEAVSDRFYSAAEKMLLPDPPRGMFDGWETRRRRGPGNDWVVIRLAAEGLLERVEVDTHFFKGNAPGSCSLEGLRIAPGVPSGQPQDFERPAHDALPWRPLVASHPLEPHQSHLVELPAAGEPVTHVRFQIYPDGGVARLRLHGRLTEAGRRAMALAELNAVPPGEAEARFLACCGARRWAREMAAARPFPDSAALQTTAEEVAETLEPDDWREAFAAHPRIGETKAGRDTGTRSRQWSEGEQAGTEGAEAGVLQRLAAGNREYEEKFGHLYLVCATGKTAEEMLALLEARLGNTPEVEFPIAVAEQRKITALRLEKLLER